MKYYIKLLETEWFNNITDVNTNGLNLQNLLCPL